MLRGHVFIVNEKSLPIHLQYMFVGTSSGGKDNNIGLLADMSRVKAGDFIFFYIEGREKEKGRFFGIFKAVDNIIYHLKGLDANKPGLPYFHSRKTKKDEPLKLIYRKKIVPYKVYPKGVYEWVALDKLPTYAKELLWTLIYRKMKGGRGNTMLLPWETKRLISLIEDENRGKSLSANDLTINKGNYTIEKGTTTRNHIINSMAVVVLKDIKRNEAHFQAYLLQNLNIPNNGFLPGIFGKDILWIGNEVFSGTGMQKIDILTIEKIDETSCLYRMIELKHPKSTVNINFAPTQFDYYINWAREDIGGHLLGSKMINIKPILFVLTESFNSVPKAIVNDIAKLNSISVSPEIWEINYLGNTNRVL
jgi:hypothetical protein